MFKNVDFNGSVETNPYKFKLYDLSGFSLYVNAKIVPSEGLKLEMDLEKTSVMGYRTLFDRSGKHHSNSEIQVTHMYINCYFMLLFISCPTGCLGRPLVSPREWQYQDQTAIQQTITRVVTCLLYHQYDSTVLLNLARKITTEF